MKTYFRNPVRGYNLALSVALYIVGADRGWAFWQIILLSVGVGSACDLWGIYAKRGEE